MGRPNQLPEPFRTLAARHGGVGELARALHVTPRTIHRWVRGEREMDGPARHLLRELVEAAGAPEGPGQDQPAPGPAAGSFAPRLDILPPRQRELYPHFRPLAAMGWVLYGGTAIALRLGHRASIDFDFFSDRHLEWREARAAVPRLGDGTVLQEQQETLTLLVPARGGPEPGVKVSFFGGLGMGRAGEPEWTSDGVLQVASLADLLAAKLKVILQRAEKKDYLDIQALLAAGGDLGAGLACARALFGKAFQPAEALKALGYFQDGDLGELSGPVRKVLAKAAQAVDRLPPPPAIRPGLALRAGG
jgi:hypothetical protein